MQNVAVWQEGVDEWLREPTLGRLSWCAVSTFSMRVSWMAKAGANDPLASAEFFRACWAEQDAARHLAYLAWNNKSELDIRWVLHNLADLSYTKLREPFLAL